MRYRPLRPGVLLSAAVALGLAGCGAVPWSTQLKLRSFDPLTFDPAVPRAAVMISDRLRVPPGQARIHLTTWHKNTPAQKTTETFTLQEVSEPAPDTLVAARNDDERIAVFRLIPADVPRARALQAQFAARNAAVVDAAHPWVEPHTTDNRVGSSAWAAFFQTSDNGSASYGRLTFCA